MFEMTIERFYPLPNHHHVKALADVSLAGITLRSLKLEKRQGHYCVATPGRKVKGRWEQLYEIRDPLLREKLRELLTERYLDRS